MLKTAPSPQAAAGLTPRRVVGLLGQVGRRNDPGLAEQLRTTTLRTTTLRQPPPVEQALAVAAAGLLEVIATMSDAITALQAQLARDFPCHKQTSIIASQPGLDPVLCARLLGELGDDPARFWGVAGVRPRSPAPPDASRSWPPDTSATIGSPTSATSTSSGVICVM